MRIADVVKRLWKGAHNAHTAVWLLSSAAPMLTGASLWFYYHAPAVLVVLGMAVAFGVVCFGLAAWRSFRARRPVHPSATVATQTSGGTGPSGAVGLRRTLTGEQRRALADVLSRYPVREDARSVQMWHYVSVPDGLSLSDAFANLFRAAGWNAYAGNITGLAQHANGIWVHGSDARNRAVAVEALQAAGVAPRVDLSEEEVDLQIIVGFAEDDQVAVVGPSPTTRVSVVPTPAEWLILEQRFAGIPGEVDAIWCHYPQTGVVKWSVYPRSKAGTPRDVQRFESEARSAGLTLQRMHAIPAKFPVRSQLIDPVDRWLNAVALLVHPGSGMHGSGHDDDGSFESGCIDNVVDASKVACGRLAAESR